MEMWREREYNFNVRDCLSQSTGVNPSRKQRYCSPSCLWSQAQQDTFDSDNSQSQNYWMAILHRCIYIWSWTEMLTVSFQPRAKTYEFRFVRVQKYVGEERCTICAHWNADYLLENIPQKTTKMLSTRNSSMLMVSSSLYLFFESDSSLTRKGPSWPLTKTHCICSFYLCEWMNSGW